MHVPNVLAMRVVDADAGVHHLFGIAVLARERVDVVQTKITNRGFPPLGEASLVILATVVMAPGDRLGPVTVVKIEIDDSSVGQTMIHHGVRDTDVDIVHPAEARGKVFGAVVARRSDRDKAPAGPAGEDLINSLTYSAERTFHRVERLWSKIEISGMELGLWLLARPEIRIVSEDFAFVLGPSSPRCQTHGTKLLHPRLAVHADDGRRGDGQLPGDSPDSKRRVGDGLGVKLWVDGILAVRVASTKLDIGGGDTQSARPQSLWAFDDGSQVVGRSRWPGKLVSIARIVKDDQGACGLVMLVLLVPLEVGREKVLGDRVGRKYRLRLNKRWLGHGER